MENRDGHKRKLYYRLWERLFLAVADVVKAVENRINRWEEARARRAAVPNHTLVEMCCHHPNHVPYLGKRFRVRRYDVDADDYCLDADGWTMPAVKFPFVYVYRECFEPLGKESREHFEKARPR